MPFLGIFLFVAGLLLIALLLLNLAARFNTKDNTLSEQINAILPQTQCGQCGYPGCRPYAEAIACGQAAINQCPPGGQAGVSALANLLGVDEIPLNTEHGQSKSVPEIARIIETDCIGCTLCIQACPVDAIIGSAKHMHTVVSKACTGCELCLAPCPVNCIVMEPAKTKVNEWVMPLPSQLPIRTHRDKAMASQYSEYKDT